MILVHLPVHASWLNQVEIHFSIVQRKALQPNVESTAQLRARSCVRAPWNAIAEPFGWQFSSISCALLVLSHLIERIPLQRGVLLGIAAGLGFGISDGAIKALSGDLGSGPVGLLSPWSVVIVTAAVFSFFASARSLQIGDGVAVIAVTSSRRTCPPSSPGWLSSETGSATMPSQ